MFITGPEVIKTVTGEDVSFEDLGGAMAHNTKSGRRALRRRRREVLHRGHQAPARRSCRPTTSRTRRTRTPATTPTAPTTTSTRSCPTRPTSPYDMRDIITPRRRRRGVLRGPAALGAQHRDRLRAPGRPPGRRRRQPAHAAGRRRSTSPVVAEGRALRAHLRRVQHADRHVRRRAGLPARHQPGVGRDHPPRRQAAVRLLRGDGPQAHRDHAQGLRRRVRRDGLQARRRRREPGLADGARSP